MEKKSKGASLQQRKNNNNDNDNKTDSIG